MQEGYTDYYEIEDDGCCLHCEDKEEGCLCFNCKCRKCYWYSSHPYEDEGSCDLADDFRDQNNFNSQFCDVGFFTVLRDTQKASLISFNDGKETWIPKKFVKDGKIQRWILQKKGLTRLIVTKVPVPDDRETISLVYSHKVFLVVRSYSAGNLAADEIVVVNPKSGRMVVVK